MCVFVGGGGGGGGGTPRWEGRGRRERGDTTIAPRIDYLSLAADDEVRSCMRASLFSL